MVLEGCLAQLQRSGFIGFSIACMSSLLDAHLIDHSKRSDLCKVVRLLPCLLARLSVALHKLLMPSGMKPKLCRHCCVLIRGTKK